MENKENNKISEKNRIFILSGIIAVILIASIISIFVQKNMHKNPVSAIIYVNGSEYLKIDLLTAEDIIIPITLENDASNVIEIKNHDIRMLSGSCPNNLCVHQGWASESAIPIVCLPNNVVISVIYSTTDNGKEVNFDAITY